MNNQKTSDAVNALSSAFQADADYAQGWHDNIACAALDEGVDHATANRIASRFMSNAFDVKTGEQDTSAVNDVRDHAGRQDAARNMNFEVWWKGQIARDFTQVALLELEKIRCDKLVERTEDAGMAATAISAARVALDNGLRVLDSANKMVGVESKDQVKLSGQEPPLQLWVRVAPSGGTISYIRKPFHFAGPVYVYRLVEHGGPVEGSQGPCPPADAEEKNDVQV